MTKRYLPLLGLLTVFAATAMLPQPATAGANLDCKMHFKTTSWSV